MQNSLKQLESAEQFLDHTEIMYSNPGVYGYSSEEELEGLTQREKERGVTKTHMLAYGEWLISHARRNSKILTF